MKVILKATICSILVFSFYCIYNHFNYKDYKVKSVVVSNNSEVMPLENVTESTEKIIIPNHHIEEVIYDDITKGNTAISITSDYLTKEDGKIVLNSRLPLSNFSLEEHIILDIDSTCYIFAIKQVGTMNEYKNALEISDKKILYLVNEEKNIFVKAEEFYKNNPSKVT